MANIDVVREIYGAFGRGDIPAILGHLAENVDWEYGPVSTDVPWLQHRRGRAQVGEFFAALQALDFHTFTRCRPDLFYQLPPDTSARAVA